MLFMQSRIQYLYENHSLSVKEKISAGLKPHDASCAVNDIMFKLCFLKAQGKWHEFALYFPYLLPHIDICAQSQGKGAFTVGILTHLGIITLLGGGLHVESRGAAEHHVYHSVVFR